MASRVLRQNQERRHEEQKDNPIPWGKITFVGTLFTLEPAAHFLALTGLAGTL